MIKKNLLSILLVIFLFCLHWNVYSQWNNWENSNNQTQTTSLNEWSSSKTSNVENNQSQTTSVPLNETNWQSNITNSNWTSEHDTVVENKEKSWFEKTVEMLENRKNSISNTLWINSIDEIEKKFKELNDKVNLSQTDQEVKNQLINDLNKKFESVVQTIDSKNVEIKELTEFISKQEWNRDELILRKNELEKEVSWLYKQKEELTKELDIEKQKLILLQTDIWELKIYRDKYEKLVKEQEESKKQEKLRHTSVYVWITLLFLLVSWIVIKRIKDIKYKSVFSVLFTFAYLSFIVIYTLLINPWFAIVFVFIASSLVIVFKEILVSLLSSVIILKRFQVWNLIEVKWMKWRILSIWPLNIILETLDKEIITIWNYIFISEPTKIHTDTRLREIVDLELHLTTEEFDEIFKWIVRICKSLDKNFTKHWDITYIMKEKVSWKLAVNMRIKTIQSWDLLLRIFHEYLKNRNKCEVLKSEVVIDENWDEKEE